MESTGEPERKRRHFSSISPTAAGVAAKKHPVDPFSEDKKLDVAVLRYKNQKLSEQLEAQKVEYLVLENKFQKLKEKQKTYDETLAEVNKSWEQLVGDLESLSASTSGSTCVDNGIRHSSPLEGGASCPRENDFLSRLKEIGATENSGCVSPSQTEDNMRMPQLTPRNILQNLLSSFNDVWHLNEDFTAAALATLPEDELSRQLLKTANDLKLEVRNFIEEVGDLHLKYRLLADKVQNHQDIDAKDKAEHRRLTEEFANTVTELEESNHRLAILKTQKDSTHGTPILYPSIRNKNVGVDVSDIQKDLQDMETSLKELTDLVSSRLEEVSRLHEERIEILKKLANLRNTLMGIKGISSSKAFQLLNVQLQKSREEMDQCRASLAKLQVEKDSFMWHEKEVILKIDIADAARRVFAFSESRIVDLEQVLQNLADKRIFLETKLEEASREPSRKEIIVDFKALVSSLPKDMAVMQSELGKNKDAALELHCLRAKVQSLSSMLHRKENELESLSGKSADQLSEIKQLQLVVQDLRKTNLELKLFLEMYRRESTDSRDIIESRNKEYEAWALVHSLKSSLDEHNLELRVKAANEAEAASQKKLAAAEAEIDELRQWLEDSERDMSRLSEILKSKHEEGEAYLSEIESIGQAYEDVQTQNQLLFQQIIERDDYNIKLVMEGVKARQMHDLMRLEIQSMNKKLQHANLLMDLYNQKASQTNEQLKLWSDQVGRLAEDVSQNSLTLENAKRKLLDVQHESQQLRQSFEGVQTKVERSRLDMAELLIEIEKESFNRKRIEEGLEVMTRKVTRLKARSKCSTVLEKLRHEVKEYRGILKCSICLDRQKEVVIAKCYHLFCHQCVQKTLESRQRRCPTCSACFGPNDVKPIYI